MGRAEKAGAGEPIIRVRDLSKQFTVREKAPGALAALRSAVRPRLRTVSAVRGISLEVASGERIAFIGPNGAGKSTTIKMLTGLLFPTAGQAEVLGRVPWERRQQLAYSIGTVFGQRSLL